MCAQKKYFQDLFIKQNSNELEEEKDAQAHIAWQRDLPSACSLSKWLDQIKTKTRVSLPSPLPAPDPALARNWNSFWVSYIDGKDLRPQVINSNWSSTQDVGITSSGLTHRPTVPALWKMLIENSLTILHSFWEKQVKSSMLTCLATHKDHVQICYC